MKDTRKYAFSINREERKKNGGEAGAWVELTISSKAISPPVALAIADRGPHQRHHHDGYDGRHDFRYRVSCRSQGKARSSEGRKKNAYTLT